MKLSRRLTALSLGFAIVASALAGCSPVATPDANPTLPTQRLAAWKNVWTCMISQDPSVVPNVFFGNQTYPGKYHRSDGSTATGAVPVYRTDWICNDSSESQAATWLPSSMDTYATVTWPNGRSADIGIQNPLLGTPKFYPSLLCNSDAPGCVGEAKFALDEGDTFRCSIVGYDLEITRKQDLSGYKYYEIVFGSASEITDDFDSPICAKI
jgi:hypothetical protein